MILNRSTGKDNPGASHAEKSAEGRYLPYN